MDKSIDAKKKVPTIKKIRSDNKNSVYEFVVLIQFFFLHANSTAQGQLQIEHE
jgi:hypothetical protein